MGRRGIDMVDEAEQECFQIENYDSPIDSVDPVTFDH
jgi:hypothetical protein